MTLLKGLVCLELSEQRTEHWVSSCILSPDLVKSKLICGKYFLNAVAVCCLAGCLTWLSSKILLSSYLENSSSWSGERKECLLPRGEGQRNTETQRPPKVQIQLFFIARAAGRENKGVWEEAAVVGVLIQRDRCPEKAVVRHDEKTFRTWKQSQYAPSVTGAKLSLKWDLFLSGNL